MVEKSMQTVAISEIMVRDVFTVPQTVSVAESAQIFAELGIRHLVVADGEGRCIGLFSERDLVKHTIHCLTMGRDPGSAVVKELMVANPITITPETTVGEVAGILASKKIGCLPVVEKTTRLVGIVSVVDVLRFVSSQNKKTDRIQSDRLHERDKAQMKQQLLDFEMAMATYETHASEVVAANHQLEEAKIRAEGANRAKSEFLANMSHEIRTPMSAILGYCDVLQERPSQPEDAELLSIIKRNGTHLLDIVNDILDLSKIEAGKMNILATNCSPLQIVNDVQSLMQGQANAKGLSFESTFNGQIPQTIKTDPMRLKQLLINLVGNAIKFTREGNVRIDVQVVRDRADECLLQFDVVDSGIGMTERQLAKLFRPFSQAEGSTTRDFGGTGLGLVICKKLAKMLGGDITVKSQSGSGSTFSLTISTGPLDRLELTNPRSEGQTRADDSITGLPPERLDCRILLAEDGPDIRRLNTMLLTRAGAYVVAAENGRIAVDKVLATLEHQDNEQQPPFDIILMDMQMPEIDGFEATRILRERGYRGSIIALTADVMNDTRDKCLAAGCDDFATKPISREKLIQIISRNVGGPTEFSTRCNPVESMPVGRNDGE